MNRTSNSSLRQDASAGFEYIFPFVLHLCGLLLWPTQRALTKFIASTETRDPLCEISPSLDVPMAPTLASIMESTRTSLDQLIAQFNWISTITRSPDIAALLHSNNLPSPLRRVNLNASMKNLEDPSRQIQTAFDLVGNAVASLETQMSRVRSLQHHYNVMLSPIRRVPAEMVMEILCHTWMAVDNPSGAHITGFNVFTVAEGPWCLGQVCRLWRDVVSTLCPGLWATMTIEFPHSGHLFRDDVAMLETVLERAGERPLDFLFRHCAVSPAEVSSIMPQCFDVMTTHSARWRRVELIVHPSFLPRLSVIHGKVDLLTDMYLKCWRKTGRPSDHITAFEIAPKLRHLYSRNLYPDIRIHFPIGALVSFYNERRFAGNHRVLEYVDIVKSSLNLLVPRLRLCATTTWIPASCYQPVDANTFSFFGVVHAKCRTTSST
ncbi:hypothetical protein ARMGADRAFT_527830 [Armillaria gallica]|uniref:F-box domain-containing protein n=1 Tax=Armillaria gallica TaxID=47427 RepID=A0A2H3E1K9_ARMGA|nr:hypothetical protein ARMGADRAFT_527830 [Armillaria gallica]